MFLSRNRSIKELVTRDGVEIDKVVIRDGIENVKFRKRIRPIQGQEAKIRLTPGQKYASKEKK